LNFSRKMLDVAAGSGVQVNKYARLFMSFIVMIVGWALAFDWTTVLEPKTAGTVMGIIGFLKFGYTLFAPKPGVATAPVGEGKGLITSVGVPTPAVPTSVQAG
jgi:hypothetical protein